MARIDAAVIFGAGLAGALGVAAAAAAAHGDGANLSTVSTMLLAHAPALLGLSAASAAGAASAAALRVAALLMIVGAALFCGDLAARDFLGDRLFPMAAPIGGSALILAWLLAALGGLLGLMRSRSE